MHAKAHSDRYPFGIYGGPANVTITLLLMLCFVILVLLFISNTSTPAQAQNAVPPTARQAAAMPQFAGRLAHAVRQNASRPRYPNQARASYKNSPGPPARFLNGGPLDDNTLYSNGAINGTTDAWTINYGFVVSDTFTVPANSSALNGLSFGAWTFPGDVLLNAEVTITSAEFGGTTYFDGVISFTQSGCSANQYASMFARKPAATSTGQTSRPAVTG